MEAILIIVAMLHIGEKKHGFSVAVSSGHLKQEAGDGTALSLCGAPQSGVAQLKVLGVLCGPM